MTNLLIVRTKVDAASSYLAYREVLREDFWYTCAYCEISEVEADGIRFTIDHYWPQSRCPALSTTYENLMWACDHCNEHKVDNPPLAALAKGYRFFNPDIDTPEDHFRYDGFRIEAKTEFVGRYTVQALDLNRANLRRMREIRKNLYASIAAMAHGLRAMNSISLDALPRHVRARFQVIRAQLGLAVDGATVKLDSRISKQLNRSPNLDKDPDAKERGKERKKYLAKVNAPLPGILPGKDSGRKGKR